MRYPIQHDSAELAAWRALIPWVAYMIIRSIRCNANLNRYARGTMALQQGKATVAMLAVVLLLGAGLFVYEVAKPSAHPHPTESAATAGLDITPVYDPAAKVVSHDFDQSGFMGIAWGASEADIRQAFGDSVVTLANPERYVNSTVTFVLPQYDVGGVRMQARFQMDGGRLVGVLLLRRAEPHPMSPTRTFEEDYAKLALQLQQSWGMGTPSGPTEIKWLRGRTKVDLDYFFQIGIDDQLTVHYEPA